MNYWDCYIMILTFVFGTIIGSFLNVCIYRIPAGMSVVKPRSRCGSCGRTLTGLDMVPILSWLFLRGKCRSCKSKVSIRYPMIEALEGILYLCVFLKYQVSFITLILWGFTSLLTVVFFIDLDHKIIPNKIVLFSLLMSLFPITYHLKSGYSLYPSGSWLEPLWGILLPTGIMLSIAVLSILIFRRSGLGYGDVKIFAPIGIFLGWKLALLSIWLSFVLGGFFGIYWIVIRKKSSKDVIPFAPFIVISSFIAIFFGNTLFDLFLI